MKHILFIQGGGNGGYEADAMLVSGLRTALGEHYKVDYPRMTADEATDDFAPLWLNQIGKEINAAEGEIILAGHSLGASLILKFLSENTPPKNITGLFLIAPPYWSGNEDWVQPLKLREDFADNLPKYISTYFYHCKDDEIVSVRHLELYKQNLPWAIFREIERGGHQLVNDLDIVAGDMKQLDDISGKSGGKTR